MSHMSIQSCRLALQCPVIFAAFAGITGQSTATAEPLYGPETCIQGFVWREARPGDSVCVPPPTRARTLQENATAADRWDPNGAYGPHTCLPGLVWREAFDGDSVCVTPDIRQDAWNDNAAAASRKAANAPLPTPQPHEGSEGAEARDPYRDCARICPQPA
jgi:hypothetical protein